MVTLEVISTTANLRTQPSSEKGPETIIASLPKKSRVIQLGYCKSQPDWVKVEDECKRQGFIKRKLMAQVEIRDLVKVDSSLIDVYDKAIRLATKQYDFVKYGLGFKRPSDGKVDCSGWIAFINRQAFNAVNAKAGRRVFSMKELDLLNTHSDHQVSIPGYETKQLFSGPEINNINWRPGLLIGINFRDYSWERGQGRVFEIDHIVQTMSSDEGLIFITQSSSSGDGVNSLSLNKWLDSTKKQIPKYHIHVVDVFALANFSPDKGIKREEELELPEPDLSRALPG